MLQRVPFLYVAGFSAYFQNALIIIIMYFLKLYNIAFFKFINFINILNISN